MAAAARAVHESTGRSAGNGSLMRLAPVAMFYAGDDERLRDMAALEERIKLLQEDIAGRVAEANNRSLYLLTIVTVLALPINIIAGLLGMNVGGIPLAQDGHGFWIIVAIIVTFTLLAAWFAFRQPRD